MAERTDSRELDRRRIRLVGAGLDDRARLGLHGTGAEINFDDDVVISKVIRGPSDVSSASPYSRLISDRASAVFKMSMSIRWLKPSAPAATASALSTPSLHSAMKRPVSISGSSPSEKESGKRMYSPNSLVASAGMESKLPFPVPSVKESRSLILGAPGASICCLSSSGAHSKVLKMTRSG